MASLSPSLVFRRRADPLFLIHHLQVLGWCPRDRHTYCEVCHCHPASNCQRTAPSRVSPGSEFLSFAARLSAPPMVAPSQSGCCRANDGGEASSTATGPAANRSGMGCDDATRACLLLVLLASLLSPTACPSAKAETSLNPSFSVLSCPVYLGIPTDPFCAPIPWAVRLPASVRWVGPLYHHCSFLRRSTGLVKSSRSFYPPLLCSSVVPNFTSYFFIYQGPVPFDSTRPQDES